MKDTKIKRKLNEIDILRGIFCLFVLTIHVTATPSVSLKAISLSSIAFSILNIATKVAVPGFIFISGLALCYNYRDKEKINVPTFFAKRFKTVVTPYILYTLLYYIVYIKNYNYEVSWNFFLTNLINGTMVYHLYYIIISIQFYLIFPFVHKLFKQCNHNLILITAIATNLLSIGLISSSTFFIKYISFFILGCYIGFNYEKIEHLILEKSIKRYVLSGGIILTIFYIIEQYSNRHFGTLTSNNSWHIFSLGCILFYLTLSKLLYYSNSKYLKRFKELLIDISKVSFSIYLIHPLALLYLENNLNIFSTSLKYIIISFIIFGLAIFYSKICKLKKKKVV